MMIRPSEISSSPATIRIAVVLPQPEGPTNTRNSRSKTSMLRSLTAGTGLPPYRFVTCSKMTRAMASPTGRRPDVPPLERPEAPLPLRDRGALRSVRSFVDNSAALVKPFGGTIAATGETEERSERDGRAAGGDIWRSDDPADAARPRAAGARRRARPRPRRGRAQRRRRDGRPRRAGDVGFAAARHAARPADRPRRAGGRRRSFRRRLDAGERRPDRA